MANNKLPTIKDTTAQEKTCPTPDVSFLANHPIGYEPQALSKKASNNAWPLSWHGFRHRGITFNEENHE